MRNFHNIRKISIPPVRVCRLWRRRHVFAFAERNRQLGKQSRKADGPKALTRSFRRNVGISRKLEAVK